MSTPITSSPEYTLSMQEQMMVYREQATITGHEMGPAEWKGRGHGIYLLSACTVPDCGMLLCVFPTNLPSRTCEHALQLPCRGA